MAKSAATKKTSTGAAAKKAAPRRSTANAQRPQPKPAPQAAASNESAADEAIAQRLSGQFALGRIGDFLPSDLLGTAGKLAKQVKQKPAPAFRAAAGFAGDLLKIARGKSELAPAPGDKRFTDPAFQQSWFYRGWLKGYLAFGQALQNFAKQSGASAMEAERAGFLLMQLTEAVAPTNNLLGNPAALRKFIDTGGGSLMQGISNFCGDVADGRILPAQSNDSSFKIGENLANSPGHVVLRTEMFELLQYSPQTEQVRERPTLLVPSIVNKFYVFDLAPGRSVVEYWVKQGITMFVMAWRNPSKEHDHWGIPEYQEAIDQAIEAVRKISKAPDVNLWGVCGAGPVVTSLVGHYAAVGTRKVNSLTLVVSPHDMGQQNKVPGIGAFTEVGAVKDAQSRRISANDFSLLFGMLRPNDLIWNYWVNNYLLGNDPPTFDILTWNNDGTGMTANFNRDFGQLVEKNLLVKPGAMKVKGKPIADLSKLDVDSYVLGAMTDHLCLWQDVYRTALLLGKRSQFVLGSSGHIQTILNPPGNPKTSYYTNTRLPATAETWIESATRHQGSWWDHGIAWAIARSGNLVDAPKAPGNAQFPPLGKAPGTYVFEKV